MKALLPQRCPLLYLYAAWLLYLLGFGYLLAQEGLFKTSVWAVAIPVALWWYVRVFPRISAYVGYGQVDDVPAEALEPLPARVKLYTSMGCPFCPIVEKRLRVLQETMGFQLEHVDLTVRPDRALGKAIGSVPVVEVGDQRIVGHATSEDLAALITRTSAALT
jgi:glutaredoxin